MFRNKRSGNVNAKNDTSHEDEGSESDRIYW
jgi:hypothetical protein